ncbi:hypothetical protein CWE09_00255 [Aliidiomarina minuta]|uniref:Type II/III secretion system secretin-like domain-containing protein n=1 Tax=Aliidiomarina minuta TaxID=880057 RepID=A0A432W567_9GAMM|nr:hypothetical protein [Aliidiomarina minuta]RUO25214.1 hypothetical protein CWE09_00255 [Aliidiomarina minuta]
MRGLFISSIAVLVLLSGCALRGSYQESVVSAEQRLAEAYAVPATTPARQHVVREQGYFVPPLIMPQYEGPAWYTESTDFIFDNYPLQEALREMLYPLSISVRLLDDIDPDIPVSLAFQGLVGDAITQLGLVTGFYFSATDHVLTLRQFEVAEFDVAFLAGSTNFFLGDDERRLNQTSAMSGHQLMPSGLSDDSAQYLNFTSESLSVWNDLEAALQLLLSAHGHIALNQSSTSILVRDYPQHVQQIREYLIQQNRRLTRQVAVDVQVIDIAFDDQEQAGIDWELVYQSASHSGIVNFSSGLVSSLTNRGSQIGIERSSGRLAGSQILINALSQQGVVEVSSHPRLVSLNNQISKIVLEDNATYLASAGSSSTPNVGSSDLLIPGVVTTGFELYLLPKIASAQVLMQLSTSLSDLKGIEQVTSGDKTIQTPHTNRKKFFMKAMVADGETLLISGLKSTRQQWQQQKTLGSWLFGGHRQQVRQRSETLLLLTPRILETGVVL